MTPFALAGTRRSSAQQQSGRDRPELERGRWLPTLARDAAPRIGLRDVLHVLREPPRCPTILMAALLQGPARSV